MSTHKGQSDRSMDPPPYPTWLDYLNGAVVATMMLATAMVVVFWMVQATVTTFN